jgi:hypothetical protein
VALRTPFASEAARDSDPSQPGYAKSIMDYLFRWLELRFLSGTQLPLFVTTAATSANAGEAPNQTPRTGEARCGAKITTLWVQTRRNSVAVFGACSIPTLVHFRATRCKVKSASIAMILRALYGDVQVAAGCKNRAIKLKTVTLRFGPV